jgi:hypothetical protein
MITEYSIKLGIKYKNISTIKISSHCWDIKLVLKHLVLHFINEKLELFLKSRDCASLHGMEIKDA